MKIILRGGAADGEVMETQAELETVAIALPFRPAAHVTAGAALPSKFEFGKQLYRRTACEEQGMMVYQCTSNGRRSEDNTATC